MTTSKPHLRERSKAATSARKPRRAPKQNTDWTRTYKTTQVCKIFRVSPRNIQYWTEQKLLNPKLETGKKYEHGGTIRSFGMRDMILVGVMVALKKKGLGLRKLRRVVPLIAVDVEAMLVGAYRYGVNAKLAGSPLRKLLGGHGKLPPLGKAWIKVTIRKRLSNATRITTLKVPLRDILNRIERA